MKHYVKTSDGQAEAAMEKVAKKRTKV
jgi:hypothetical protein